MKILHFAILIAAISGCTSGAKVRSDVKPLPDSVFRIRYMSAAYNEIIKDSAYLDNDYKKAFYSEALSEIGQLAKARRFVPEIEKFKFKTYDSRFSNKPYCEIKSASHFSTYSGWALYKYCFNQKGTVFDQINLLGDIYQMDSTNPLVRIEAMKFITISNLPRNKKLEIIKTYQHLYPYWLELYERESMLLIDIDKVDYNRVTEIASFLLEKRYHAEYQNKILEYISFRKDHPDSLTTFIKKYNRLINNHLLPRVMRKD